jgi:hypothetical protein
MVASHPSRKNKDAARVGHPATLAWWLPTLAARTETRRGWGTRPFHETIQIGRQFPEQPGHADSYRSDGFQSSYGARHST